MKAQAIADTAAVLASQIIAPFSVSFGLMSGSLGLGAGIFLRLRAQKARLGANIINFNNQVTQND